MGNINFSVSRGSLVLGDFSLKKADVSIDRLKIKASKFLYLSGELVDLAYVDRESGDHITVRTEADVDLMIAKRDRFGFVYLIII